MVPDQISVTGYDDSVYASMIRPKLTTVHQDIPAKSTCGIGTSDEIDSGRDAERIKYKKTSLSGKEGFCQRMTESLFFCPIVHKNRSKTLFTILSFARNLLILLGGSGVMIKSPKGNRADVSRVTCSANFNGAAQPSYLLNKHHGGKKR